MGVGVILIIFVLSILSFISFVYHWVRASSIYIEEYQNAKHPYCYCQGHFTYAFEHICEVTGVSFIINLVLMMTVRSYSKS